MVFCLFEAWIFPVELSRAAHLVGAGAEPRAAVLLGRGFVAGVFDEGPELAYCDFCYADFEIVIDGYFMSPESEPIVNVPGGTMTSWNSVPATLIPDS